jgi:hypothetical protein
MGAEGCREAESNDPDRETAGGEPSQFPDHGCSPSLALIFL